MDKDPVIDAIHFVPMKRREDGFVGFVSFNYNGQLAIKSVSVYERLDKTAYRLVYPSDIRFRRTYVQPFSRKYQQYIEAKINDFINKNYSVVDGEFELKFNSDKPPLDIIARQKEIDAVKSSRGGDHG